MEHLCRLYGCFNHSGFLVEFGSNNRGALKRKKKSTGNSFLFPQTKYKIEAVIVHVCICMRVFNV